MTKIIFFLLFVLPLFAYGQFNPSQYTIISNSNHKSQHLDRIYKELLSNLHDKRKIKPILYLVKNARTVAFFSKTNDAKPVIVFEEFAYDICMKTENPDRALAIILGHELGHFYHNLRGGFAEHESGNLEGLEAENVRHTELKADLFGAILARISSYTQDLDLIEELYQGYKFKGIALENPSYPSREKRVETYKNAEKEAKKFANLFRTANYLTILQEYEKAAECYEQIAEVFPTIEIYNNLSVCWALSAYDPPIDGYILPFEAVLASPLSLKLRAGETSLISLQQKIEKAQKYLSIAHGFDPNYPSITINQTCIYILQNKIQQAKDLIGNGVYNFRDWTNFQQIDYWMLRTILEVSNGMELIIQLKIKGYENYPLFRHNYAIYNHENIRRLPPGIPHRTKELIANLCNLGTSEDFTFCEAQNMLSLKISNFVFQMPSSEKSEANTKNKIKIGSLQTDVIAAYGEARHFLQTAQGYFMIYPDVLFLIGSEQKVLNWIIYKK